MEAENFTCKLISSSSKFELSDRNYNLDFKTKPKQIHSLIRSQLEDNEEVAHITKFDLLINDKLLTTSLKKHFEDQDGLIEKVIEIQVFEHFPCPSEQNSLEHDDWVKAVSVSSKAILTGCYDNSSHIWSLEGEHLLAIPDSHEDPVLDIAWIKSGSGSKHTFVTSSYDNTATIWEWNSKKNQVTKLISCIGHNKTVECVHVHESGTKIATGDYDGKLMIWPTEVESKSEEPKPKRKKGDKLLYGKPVEINPTVVISAHNTNYVVNDLEWLDSVKLCTVSIDNSVKIWDINREELDQSFTGPQGILSVSYSQLNKTLITSQYDGIVRRWDPRIKEGTTTKKMYDDSISFQANACAWSPSSEYHFVCGYDDHILRLWDTRSCKKPIHRLTSHSDMIHCVDWKLPSSIMSGGADKTLKIHQTSF